MNREFGLTHLLIGLCALFVVVAIGEWIIVHLGIEENRELMGRPVKGNFAFDEVDSVEFELPPEEMFEDIIERPLMIRGRRPVDEQKVEVDTPVVAARTDLKMKLMGVIMTPSGMTALMQDSSGKYKRVKLNGQLDGWEISELKADKVVLKQGGSSQELMLRKPKPKIARPVKKPAAKKRRRNAKSPRVKKNAEKVKKERPKK